MQIVMGVMPRSANIVSRWMPTWGHLRRFAADFSQKIHNDEGQYTVRVTPEGFSSIVESGNVWWRKTTEDPLAPRLAAVGIQSITGRLSHSEEDIFVPLKRALALVLHYPLTSKTLTKLVQMGITVWNPDNLEACLYFLNRNIIDPEVIRQDLLFSPFSPVRNRAWTVIKDSLGYRGDETDAKRTLLKMLESKYLDLSGEAFAHPLMTMDTLLEICRLNPSFLEIPAVYLKIIRADLTDEQFAKIFNTPGAEDIVVQWDKCPRDRIIERMLAWAGIRELALQTAGLYTRVKPLTDTEIRDIYAQARRNDDQLEGIVRILIPDYRDLVKSLLLEDLRTAITTEPRRLIPGIEKLLREFYHDPLEDLDANGLLELYETWVKRGTE